MNLPLNNRKWNTLVLAFAFPFLGMLFVMLVSGYEPFGDSAILYSDMYHQYYPFFVEFRRALLSGESLLHSWSVGLGMDYLGLIAYYLASPLNILCVLVPENWLLEFFSLLTPLRLGLAGLSFAYLLKKIFGKDDVSVPVFASFYGLCSWALGYLWNIRARSFSFKWGFPFCRDLFSALFGWDFCSSRSSARWAREVCLRAICLVA